MKTNLTTKQTDKTVSACCKAKAEYNDNMINMLPGWHCTKCGLKCDTNPPTETVSIKPSDIKGSYKLNVDMRKLKGSTPIKHRYGFICPICVEVVFSRDITKEESEDTEFKTSYIEKLCAKCNPHQEPTVEKWVEDLAKENSTGEYAEWEKKARAVLTKKMLYFPAKPILDDLMDGLRPIVKSLLASSVQEAKAEGYQQCLTELCKKAKKVGLTSELIDIIFPKVASLKQEKEKV